MTIEDSEMMARMQARGQTVVVRLQMGATMAPMTDSFNVLGDILGEKNPEEIVLIGGHSDSWDVGQGAIDDGGGKARRTCKTKLLGFFFRKNY